MSQATIGEVTVQLDVPARMRDGTPLLANIYRPAAGGPFPVLLTRLPYGKDLPLGTNYLNPLKAARQGYLVVVQDVRGRGKSGGPWQPFSHEFADGADTVAWAARLPGANGRVGMYGASYFGMTQWQAAVMQPAELAALAPALTWGNYLNGVSYRGGAWELGLALYWTHAALAFDSLARAYGADPAQLAAKLVEEVAVVDLLADYYDVLPLRDLPDPVGVAPELHGTMARPLDDAHWRELAIDGRYDAVRASTLHVGGWYDTFLGETLRQYAAMAAVASARGTRPPRLVVAPWTHGANGPMQGDLNFGLASSAFLLNYRGDLTDLHLRWFDATLKGRDDALAGQPPVEIFVMGENRWRGFDAWPPPGATTESWYFHSAGGANTSAGDGVLSRTPPGDEPPDQYAYDPRDPVPTRGGALLMPALFPTGPVDQRPNEARPDVLCYTSAPLERDYLAIGAVSVTLYAASSAPDTDFVARLVDVYPDGRAIAVTDGIIRASARESYPAPGEIHPTRPTPIEPDRVYSYTLDLWATALVFQAGHRIRIEVTSSNFPRWDRNLNTGQDGFVSAETAVARQRIFHDATRPSRLTLGVLEG